MWEPLYRPKACVCAERRAHAVGGWWMKDAGAV
jgi:hypothetical protein